MNKKHFGLAPKRNQCRCQVSLKGRFRGDLWPSIHTMKGLAGAFLVHSSDCGCSRNFSLLFCFSLPAGQIIFLWFVGSFLLDGPVYLCCSYFLSKREVLSSDYLICLNSIRVAPMCTALTFIRQPKKEVLPILGVLFWGRKHSVQTLLRIKVASVFTHKDVFSSIVAHRFFQTVSSQLYLSRGSLLASVVQKQVYFILRSPFPSPELPNSCYQCCYVRLLCRLIGSLVDSQRVWFPMKKEIYGSWHLLCGFWWGTDYSDCHYNVNTRVLFPKQEALIFYFSHLAIHLW